MKYADFSFYAVKVKTGEIVVSKNKQERMIPASTMKLLTAYSAMDILGNNHRFETDFGITGTVDSDGVLNGDVVIIGGGDPVLGSTYFSKHYEANSSLIDQLVAKLKEKGIKKVKGRIVGDGSIYDDEVYPTDWVTEDIGNYYGAGTHGLSFRENYYEIFLNSSSTLYEVVSIDESSSLLPYLNYQVKAKGTRVNSDQVYVYSPAYSDYAILRGEMPINKSKYKIKAAMTDPGLEVARLLEVACIENAISVSNGIQTVRKISLEKGPKLDRDNFESLMKIRSPELIDIINYMNMKSNNLIAEHLVKHISKTVGDGSGSTRDGLKSIKIWLQKKGVGSDGITLKDGSGLSHTNLLNTNWFVTMLVKMSSETWFEEVKNGLPLSGKTGSMRRVGKGTSLEGNMSAKTGYISGVRAYSGYLNNAKGELVAFSIMANNYGYSPSNMRKEIAKLLLKLY